MLSNTDRTSATILIFYRFVFPNADLVACNDVSHATLFGYWDFEIEDLGKEGFFKTATASGRSPFFVHSSRSFVEFLFMSSLEEHLGL